MDGKLYSRSTAANYLGISTATLDAARKKGKIAYIQYVDNGSVFFTESALDEYLAKYTHKEMQRKEERMTYRKRRV